MTQTQATGRIRISKVPRGEAPYWVREEWLGVELPCQPFLAHGYNVRGALSHARSGAEDAGYMVPQNLALDALAKKSPQATEWWRNMGFPKSLPNPDCFFFGQSEAEALTPMEQEKIHVWSDLEQNWIL